MNLHIHIGTNLEYFDLLNEGYLLSQGKADRDIADFIMQNYPGELATNISPQYEVNFMGIREIKKKIGKDAFNKIDGIYYGSDNCEYLAAYKHEIEKAIEKFQEFNKKYPPHTLRTFTFVTPYVGDTMLGKLEESLEYLHNLNIKNPIEVVVNDFGVLRLVEKKYTNLKPVFGRVIHKILKTPLIDTFGYEAHPAGEKIKNKSEQEKLALRDEIVKWQMKFYNSAEVSLGIFQKFLDKYNVERVTLDFMEKREQLFDNDRFAEVGVDLYYPWALIFTGRLCDTSAIENPSRGMYATDDICPRSCNRYDVHYKIKTSGYNMLQRGNAGYRSELNLDFLPEAFIKNQSNRLVFAPFVTV
ncbi:hypothetical protein N8455_00665 [Candidatus Gracilibacteria bacterium]|nr:hypothetical protein [Candidatus Gracilibacteria bacterium]